MKVSILGTALVAAAALLPQASMATDGGYVTLSSSGEKVLTKCNPKNRSSVDRCRVNSLPGVSGYTQVASRSVPVIKNDITIGTLYDRVWKDGSDNYIFGMRVQLNTNSFDLAGLSFNANDLFRQVLADKSVAIAYYQSNGSKALKKAGRTVRGLNEPPIEEEEEEEEEESAEEAEIETPTYEQPQRNNGWADFRIDANAAEPSGPSSASSPWLLVKTKAPSGYAVKPFAVRVLNSDFEDNSLFTEIYVSGYQPN